MFSIHTTFCHRLIWKYDWRVYPSARPTRASCDGSAPCWFSSPGTRLPGTPSPRSCSLGAATEARVRSGRWGCRSGHAYTCKTGVRSGSTAAHTGRLGSIGSPCWPGAARGPQLTPELVHVSWSWAKSVCCSMVKCILSCRSTRIIKGAGLEAAGNRHVVQFVLIHFCSSLRIPGHSCSPLLSSGLARGTGARGLRDCITSMVPPGLIAYISQVVPTSWSNLNWCRPLL